MRIFSAVVAAATRDMSGFHAGIAEHCTAGGQLVRYDGIRRETLSLQQLSHQFQCSHLVSSGLNQDVKYDAFCINGSPQVHSPAIYRDKNLIQMPARIGARPGLSQACGICSTEFQTPAPGSFIGYVDTTFSEQILYVAKTQREAEVQPDCILDDLGWKAMTGIGNLLHRMTVPECQPPVTRLL